MINLEKISEEEKTPLVMELLHAVEYLMETVEQLKGEIARLKQHKGKPKIPPSRLDKEPKEKQKKGLDGKCPGPEKRSKTEKLIIHETIPVPPRDIPPGSVRMGHNDYVVQGITIELRGE